MKKVTKYTCPYCGKNNWDVEVCDEHYELWVKEVQVQRSSLKNQNQKCISYLHKEFALYAEDYVLFKEATNGDT